VRALTVTKPGALSWRDVAEPTLRSDAGAVVRPFIAARCDGDPVFLGHNFERALTLADGFMSSTKCFSSPHTNPFAAPFEYGHECVAGITTLGRDVKNFSVRGGAKSIGLYAAGIAKALGASRVDYRDASKTRLAIAEKLGANAIEKSRAQLRDYPITVDASSSSKGLAYAIAALAPGGTCTGVGFYVRRGTPVPLWKMYMTSATLRVGVSHPRAVLDEVLALVAEKKFDPSIVTTLVADWDDAPRALFERTTKVILQRAPTLPRVARA
jgi:hypothetical protein